MRAITFTVGLARSSKTEVVPAPARPLLVPPNVAPRRRRRVHDCAAGPTPGGRYVCGISRRRETRRDEVRGLIHLNGEALRQDDDARHAGTRPGGCAVYGVTGRRHPGDYRDAVLPIAMPTDERAYSCKSSRLFLASPQRNRATFLAVVPWLWATAFGRFCSEQR